MKKFFIALSLSATLSIGALSGVWAQDETGPVEVPAAETPADVETPVDADDLETEHAELRELREALTEAVIKNDIETQLKYVHDDVVTTWQNNQVARGEEGLRAFMEEMSVGDDRVFQGYRERPVSDDLAIFHNGDTAIAFGKSVPHYKYMGKEFELENRWTATLVKTDGQWKIAAYHVSANVMDNPILDAALQSATIAAVVALLTGLLIGVIGTKLLGKKRQSAA